MNQSLAIFTLLFASSAFSASPKMEELKSACVQNPSHQVCQEMEHKKQKAKETRERKIQLKINSVKGINHE